MANSRKKISELPALNVASLDTTFVLGISGSTTYKISINNLTSSLDGAFATDLVTNALSSSLNSKLSTSSFNSYTSSFTASVASGTISGSSQLTSSFDQRYVVSGSITQTTWDNIANKPSGIVSQSTDLSSLNTFTASISTASLVNRLNTIESVSGSWITESETGSFLTNLSGAISSSTQISALGFVTGSYTTINSFNSLTQSFNSISQSFNVISGSVGTVDFNGIVSGSSQLTSSYDTRYTLSGSILTSFSTSVDSRLDNLEAEISSSVSYAYITYITEPEVPNNDANGFLKPDGSISGSISYNQSTGYFTLLAGKTYKLRAVVNMSGGGSAFQPLWNLQWKDVTNNNFIGKQSIYSGDGEAFAIITPNTNIQVGLRSLSNPENGHPYIIKNSTFFFIEEMALGIVEGITGSTDYTQITNKPTLISSSAQITTFGFVSGSYETTGRGIISSSANLVTTSSFNSYTASISTASLVTSISNLNSATSSYLTSLSGAISSSSQLTSSFDTRYVASGSISAVPAGTISGSAQLTSSYDSRYSLSGSVLTSFSSSVDTRLDTLEASIISGSVNYVQTLGARVTGVTTTGVIIITGSITTTGNPIQIMVTGDANPVNVTSWTRLQIYRNETAIGNIVQVENSSNLNVPYCLNVIDAPSAGTYTYSMRTVSGISGLFDFGESTGPTLTAVELKTNTNLPSTNNTFTGTNTFNNTTTFATGGGDEGGEIQFGVPVTNTTLQNRVTTDIFQNRFRIFEGSADSKGVYIDLSKAPAGNSGEITYKASGIVNAGTFVTLDNIKATFTTSGNRGLSIVTISGSFVAFITGTYTLYTGGVNGMGGNTTITTTSSTSLFGWSFFSQGDLATYIVNDTTNSRAYRITLMVGGGYNSNLITIERLH